MVLRLEHVHLKTKDPDKTAKFYMEALGAKSLDRPGNTTGWRLDLHGVIVNITEFIDYQKREQKYGLEHFALETDDLDGVKARIIAQGGKLLEEMVTKIPERKGARVCWLEGPEGVQVELIELK